jgi:hypothetical protein
MPQSSIDWLFVSAVLFSALSYWIVSRQFHPGEPMSITALYRAGDIENYPFILMLSRFRLSESVVYELAGKGVAPFPIWSSLPHGLGFRFFGPAGFVVVDLLGYLAFYFACVAMLGRLKVHPLVAKSVTVLILSGGLAMLSDLLACFSFLQRFPISLEFWGLRITRPFPSSILLCICMALFFRLLSDDQPRRRVGAWACFGVSSALLLQADPYSAITIAICTPFLLLGIVARHRTERGVCVRNILICLAAFVLFAIPYIIQRACELPESPRRLGVFPVDRGHPLWLPYPNFTFLRVVWLVAICAAAIHLHFRSTNDKARTALGLAGLCTASYLSLPLTCVLFGKTLQVYHFAISFHVFVFLALLVFCLAGLTAIIDAAARLDAKPLFRTAAVNLVRVVVAVVLVFSIRWSLERAELLAGRTGHVRSDFPEWQALGPTYRSDFAALVRELSKPDYAGREVVGTFDHQVYAWWATFRPGCCFLPDAALSVLPDEGIENRLIALCRTVGMSGPQFREFVLRRYASIFWLGHAKYQASQAYTFAPLSDYTPDQQRKISKTDVRGSWGSLVPRSEADRLLYKFDSTAGGALPGRLDLIVLTKDESLSGLSPAEADFAPAYANDSFSLWRRR